MEIGALTLAGLNVINLVAREFNIDGDTVTTQFANQMEWIAWEMESIHMMIMDRAPTQE